MSNPTLEGIHLHILQAAALDPAELQEETKSLFIWLNEKEPGQKEEWETAQEALLKKDAPKAWEILKDVHLRLSSKNEETLPALMGWQLCQTLYRAYRKWRRYDFPYTEICNPPPEDLEEAESRCREALLLTIAFYPFLKGEANCTKENDTPRHCLAYTLLSCLHSDTPSLEGELSRLKSIAFAKKIEPKLKESKQERLNILTQSILLVAYGGPISKNEWSRPSPESMQNLLQYVYGPEGTKIQRLIPQETNNIYDTLKRLEIL